MTPTEAKKWWERKWAEEAARLLSQSWQLGADREEPDFIVHDGHQHFGLEITLAFGDLTANGQSKAREREAFNSKLLRGLSQRWAELSDVILQVDVLGPLDEAAENQVLRILKGLKMQSRMITDPQVRAETESGIRVFARVAFRSRWHQVDDAVGWVTQNAVAQAQAAIDRKAAHLAKYQSASGDDVRLLIVADHSRASGMLELESIDALSLAGFSRAYFMTFPGGPIREIT